jgi:hypothetical protein
VHDEASGHDTDISGAYPERSAVCSAPHPDPFQVVDCPTAFTATHEVADPQDTALKSLEVNDLCVQELPFHVERMLADTSTQNPLEGHDRVPARESKA